MIRSRVERFIQILVKTDEATVSKKILPEWSIPQKKESNLFIFAWLEHSDCNYSVINNTILIKTFHPLFDESDDVPISSNKSKVEHISISISPYFKAVPPLNFYRTMEVKDFSCRAIIDDFKRNAHDLNYLLEPVLVY